MERKGFTLIELIMVIAIISIISVVAVPYIFRGASALSVPAMAKKVRDDIGYAQSLAMRGARLDTPDTANPAFRYRIRFNVADANCPGAAQYAVVSDQDNNGNWGERPNASGIVESGRNPSTGDDYFCVQLEAGDYSGFSVTADFGGATPGVLEFDSLGVPYDSDGIRLSAQKTVTISKGGETAAVNVTPYTGKTTVQ